MRIGAADTARRVVVVAEIGNNHEGDAGLAAEMVAAAAAAGADAVKLQAIEPRRLVRPTEAERLAQLERFRLSPEELARLAAQAHDAGMAFLCTPFDLDAVARLEPLVDAYKIASGDNDLDALIRACARTGRPVLISMGMTDAAGAAHAVSVAAAEGAEVAALHCVSAYPTPAQDAALRRIEELAAALPGVTIGYSDHTLGIDACVLAVALGARVLEKHFTLRHDLSSFRDHRLSADPGQLAELVRRVREAEAMLAPVGTTSDAEAATAAAARRSIVAAADLPAGHVLADGDLWWLRPADGMAPGREAELLGRALARDVTAGEPLDPADVGIKE
ncbi:MAG TPA: N-acetylneuraminate synthase family protein [Solirubrobacteraceae bacterium]|jgi:sialic acid synthase SpsE|nr:N-acetylneuraminate synthase family protein [Solirubrobacteraceae bacterium]